MFRTIRPIFLFRQPFIPQHILLPCLILSKQRSCDNPEVLAFRKRFKNQLIGGAIGAITFKNQLLKQPIGAARGALLFRKQLRQQVIGIAVGTVLGGVLALLLDMLIK
jgi:hypothetical protein